jgi:hypothetical protein
MSTSLSSRPSPSVAYCFYGQYRTANYAMPWLKEMVISTDNVKSVFCSTKIMNTYPNSIEDLEKVVTPPDKARATLVKTFPGIELDLSLTVHKALDPNRGYWHYARMIWSMNKVLQMYNVWAKDHGDVDLIVLSRLDSLIGPQPTSLGSWFRHQKPKYRHLWTCPGTMHFSGSELGVGLGDLLLIGTPMSINSLLSYSLECLSTRPRLGWATYRHGPNLLFKRAADASSLLTYPLPVRIALVRPNADLSIPVFDSFEHHAKFWTDNHKEIHSK